MPIDTSVPYSDGWLLEQLYKRLRKQQKHAEEMYQRFIGNPPLPPMSPNQQEAVRWFVSKARTNFERLCVNAVLSRLRIRGLSTVVDEDEGGDAEAYKTWSKARGKNWARQAHKFALTMGMGFVAVGRDSRDKLLVTAEDPRQVAIMSDPADPTRVIAALKLVHDFAAGEDVAYFFRLEQTEEELLGGRRRVTERSKMRIAKRPRTVTFSAVSSGPFESSVFEWVTFPISGANAFDAPGTDSEDYYPEWLQESGDQRALVPIVPFLNEDEMAEFEPHLEILDRISQQILQRMTIATIQAFKQRAMKGLPQRDPKTGEKIDYDKVFISEPGAIWNIPASVEIWESGAVDLQPILLSIRDDVKDFAAASGTPLYTVTPDVANGSAEGASLQRETLTFKVESKQESWGLSHSLVAELIFRTTGDPEDLKRAEPNTIEIMWGPPDRPSMSERANAIAQTKGSIPTYYQMTEIWGMDPRTADQAMTLLQAEQQQAAAMAAAAAPKPPGAPGAPGAGSQTKQLKPGASATPQPPKGLPDVTKPPGLAEQVS